MTETRIVALDCFEHAYWMDFGTGKAAYIDTFFKILDWDAVQRRAEQFGIDFVETFWSILFGFGRGVVDDVLIIDRRVVDVGPGGLPHGLPMPIGL